MTRSEIEQACQAIIGNVFAVLGLPPSIDACRTLWEADVAGQLVANLQARALDAAHAHHRIALHRVGLLASGKEPDAQLARLELRARNAEARLHAARQAIHAAVAARSKDAPSDPEEPPRPGSAA